MSLPCHFLFFAGKGGVGKTTCAAATALRLTEQGRRVLAVSTDPAHSLGDAFGVPLAAEPVPIAARRGALTAAELDADRGLARWLGERREDLEILAERGTWLDRDDVRRLFDLSLPGIDELIGMIELLRLARESSADTVVVDTAPTAHTLRLLAAPGELRRFAAALDRLQERHRAVVDRLGDGWRPDRSDETLADLEAEAQEIEDLLRDPRRTALSWVLLPEALAVAETRDGVGSLEEAGLPVAELIVNRVLPPQPEGESSCAFCDARRRAERAAIDELWTALPGRPVRYLPELEREPRGPAALRRVARGLAGPTRGEQLFGGPSPPGPLSRPAHTPTPGEGERLPEVRWLTPGIVPRGTRLLFFGGKGGAGKTTCAAAAALLLAEQQPESRILLLSTDPAHSLADVLATALGDDERAVPGAPAGLQARELDAARTFEDWRAHLLEQDEKDSKDSKDEEDQVEGWRDLLALAPPGLDELSAISELADVLAGAPQGDRPDLIDLIVVDTAPTGHALRLLAAPDLMLSWAHALISLLLKYREAVALGRLAAELVDLSRRLKLLIEVLRDPARTRFLVVTRPADLPRRETVRLLAELDRLGIAAPAVVVDAVLPAGCPRCGRAARAQRAEIGRLRKELRGGSGACAIIEAPAVSPPPRGVTALADWGRTWETTTA